MDIAAIPVVIQGGPNLAEWLTAAGTLAAAVGLVVAFIGVFMTRSSLQEAVKSRHAEIAMDMARRWDADDLIEAKTRVDGLTAAEFEALYMQLRDSDTRALWQVLRLANYFEDLGTLHKLDCLDLDWIDEMVGSAVMEYWETWRATAIKERSKWPKLYDNWETIDSKLRERRGLPQLPAP